MLKTFLRATHETKMKIHKHAIIFTNFHPRPARQGRFTLNVKALKEMNLGTHQKKWVNDQNVEKV